MLQDSNLPHETKETSLMTHPDTSMKMYDISIRIIYFFILSLQVFFFIF